MRIVVAIPSRARPLALIGSVMASWRLASGTNDVEYVVGADKGDSETLDACMRLAAELPLSVCIAPPPTTLASVSNLMVHQAQGADAVTVLSDRIFTITDAWDTFIAGGVHNYPKRVMWWSCAWDHGCIAPIMPKAWLEAARWSYAMTDTYPFWFIDTALQEIDMMVHGGPSLKIRAAYSGQRGKTTNGRDFAFWFRVFAAERGKRRTEARRIAARLGQEQLCEDERVEQYFAAYDAEMQTRCADFEKRFGDQREPDESYLAAKKRAEMILKEAA